jgi:4-amino-4-deoxy-L-arabinose transferase-like glycosyltransferase
MGEKAGLWAMKEMNVLHRYFLSSQTPVYLLSFFVFLLFIYHLATLNISPIPWFDETFLASLTASFNETKKLNLGIAPFAYKGEVLIYGPVYFWITSFTTRILGFDIFSFRLPGLVFGILCLLVYYKVLRIYLTRGLALVVVAAFALDPLLSTHMHSGRMEPTTLFFALVSILLVLKVISGSYKTPKAVFLFAVAGFSFSVALLTTPRAGFLLVALAITQIYYLSKKISFERILQLLSFGATLIAVYVIWIFLAFGNFANYLAYYAGLTEYVGGNFSFPKQQIPLILTTVMAVILGLIKNHKQPISELVVLALASIAVFYIVVNDTGTYSVYILPFYYALLGIAVSTLLPRPPWDGYKMWMKVTPLIAILAFNLLFFSFKFITVYMTSDSRDPKHITTFIKKYIPPESKVIGDEIFFYAVLSAKSDFQYIHLFKVDSVREHYQREIYDYDFIVMSHDLNRIRPELLKLYQKNADLIKVAEFVHKGQKNLPFIESLSDLLQVRVRSSYDCIIYKRLK